MNIKAKKFILFSSFSNCVLFVHFVFLLMIFTSCATTVRSYVKRPAELDLRGAKTIAVLPLKPLPKNYAYGQRRTIFDVYDFLLGIERTDPEVARISNYLKSEIEDGLYSSGYIKPVSSEMTMTFLNGNKNVTPADVYLVGEITEYRVDDKKYETRKGRYETEEPRKPVQGRKDELNPTFRPANNSSYRTTTRLAPNEFVKGDYIYEETWERRVQLEIRYQIVESSTQEIIGIKNESVSGYSLRYDNPRNLPSPYEILNSKLYGIVNEILRAIQPYGEYKSFSLLSYKNHERMKYADQLAKDKNINESYEEFYNIYRNENIFEAGYNAVMLLESQGKFNEAEKLAEEIATQFPGNRIYSALKDIRYEMNSAEKLQRQNDERKSK